MSCAINADKEISGARPRKLIMRSLDPSPIAVFSRRFTEVDATRLLWRAGFGPKPGQARAMSSLGLDAAVASLTRPSARHA